MTLKGFRHLCFCAAILGLLLGALSATGCRGGGLKPEAAALQFLEYWQAGDFSAMYGMLTAGAQDRYSLEQFSERYTSIGSGIGLQSLSFSVGEVLEQTGDRARVAFTVSMDTATVGPVPVTNVINLTRESRYAPWLVDWGPELIFPELRDNRRLELTRQFPERGSIYDRYGRPLAQARIYKEVGAVPGRNPDEEAMLRALAELLGSTPEALRRKMEQPWVREGLYVPLAVLTPEQEHLLPQLQSIAGVAVREVERRFYPAGESLGHLIGYLGEITAEELAERVGLGFLAGDLVGRAGLERALEPVLAGNSGFSLRVVEENGAPAALIARREASPGVDVTLTIDLDLQEAAISALGEKAGAVVALDPQNGDVLVLASTPGFDANWFITGEIDRLWPELESDALAPFLNRALEGLYPPGSIFKPYTAAVALGVKSLDPESIIVIEGDSWQPSPAWGGYRVQRVNPVTRLNLAEAMKYSDNIYFARAGLAVGAAAFEAYGERFGFGEKIPFLLPVAISSLSQGGIHTDIQLADSSYGQGEVLVTPLQAALLYCAFATGGKIPLPRLLLAPAQEAGIWKEALEAENAATIHRALVHAVHGEGAPAAGGAVEGFTVAGKSGTAQLHGSDSEGNICWYVTYGPAESPQIVVAAVVEGGRWATEEALPVARAVLEAYLLAGK